MNRRLLLSLLAIVFASSVGATGVEPPPLTGWVDMHTHPMAHLGFGGKLLQGAPDLQILMSAIPSGDGCHHYAFPSTREEASREDRAIHGGWWFDNTCGDILRREFIRGLESELGARVGHQDDGAVGYPVYNSFPAHNDLTHQQMWIDWVHRAYSGGLRVMVSLAVNNRTLAAAVMGGGDINGDDVSSANVQIEQMKVLVSRHPWMEIAYTPEDLRRIVAAGHLAIILGVEIDNIGNMQWNPAVGTAGDPASRAFVSGQLQQLWNDGVRYIFPVHVVDNKMGGTAIYEDQFNTSNFHQNGTFWDIGCAPASDNIAHTFQVAGFDLAYAIIKLKIGIDPFAAPPPPPVCSGPDFAGHRNNRDLTPLGEFAIEEMMRMGMLIDIDHMSSRAVGEALDIAESWDYPVNSGHNGPRAPSWARKNENSRTDAEYARISALGGMVGIGSEDKASNYVRTYQYVSGLVAANQIAIGTDANGMVILPGPDPAASANYDTTFTRLTDGARTWDLAVDGVANYGLFADYVRSWPSVGMTAAQHQAFHSSAEGFARMWERVKAAQTAMIPAPPVANAGGPYTVAEGSSVALDASATTDPNQPANTLTYEWDLDADGAYDDATGSAPSFSAADGPTTVTVGLRVTDSDAMTATATATVSVTNVAPSATLVQRPPTMVFAGLPASFEFTAIVDPSSADVAAGFTFSVDCTDDGVFDVSGAAPVASCVYPASGTYTVRGRITDKDAGFSESTVSVRILSPAEAADAIEAMIRATASLNRGQANALIVKLDRAMAFHAAGNIAQAVHHLEVLLNQIEEFRADGILTPVEAADLTFWINQLIASIEASTP